MCAHTVYSCNPICHVPLHVGAMFKDLRTFAQLWPQLGLLPQERRRDVCERIVFPGSPLAQLQWYVTIRPFCHSKAATLPPFLSCFSLPLPSGASLTSLSSLHPHTAQWNNPHFNICIGYKISQAHRHIVNRLPCVCGYILRHSFKDMNEGLFVEQFA